MTAAALVTVLLAGCSTSSSGATTSASLSGSFRDTPGADATITTTGSRSAVAPTASEQGGATVTVTAASADGAVSSAAAAGPVVVAGFTGGGAADAARLSTARATGIAVQPDTDVFDASKFAHQLAAGGSAVPDVIYLNRQLLAGYAAAGQIQPVSGCPGVKMGQFYPAAVQESTWTGRMYGVPDTIQMSAVLANPAVLAQTHVPVSALTDPFGHAAVFDRAVASMFVPGSTIGFDPDILGQFPLWVKAAGADLVKAGGEPDLASPQAVAALSAVAKLVDEQGGWANVETAKATWNMYSGNNPFSTNQVGAAVAPSWYPQTLATYGASLAMTAAPVVDKTGRPVAVESGLAFAIPTAAPNPVGACRFIAQVTSAQAWVAGQQALAASGVTVLGLLSANRAANKAQRPAGGGASSAALTQAVAAQAVYTELADRAVPVQPSPVAATITTAWQQAVTDALEGNHTPAAALSAAQAAAESAWKAARNAG